MPRVDPPPHSLGVRALFVAFLLLGCGSHELPPPNLPPFPEEPAAEPRPPAGTLWREDVDQALAAGLGQFLQLVTVEPYLEGDSFVGWEVQELRPPEAWEGVDLRPGDVVTAVNGMPIERDHEAFAAFESLAKATELRVAILRDAVGRELVFRIVPAPPRASGKPSPAAPASAAPAASTTAAAGSAPSRPPTKSATAPGPATADPPAGKSAEIPSAPAGSSAPRAPAK